MEIAQVSGKNDILGRARATERQAPHGNSGAEELTQTLEPSDLIYVLTMNFTAL